MTMTIRQPKQYGEGETDYTMEQYVELFTWHSAQLFKVIDADDPDFATEWQEMMDFDKKIRAKAMKRFVAIYTKQNA